MFGLFRRARSGPQPPAPPPLRLTQRAARALTRAQAEAAQLALPATGPECLLLALLADDAEPAVRVLRALGAEPGRTRRALVAATAPARAARPRGSRPLTPAAERLMRRAGEEARACGHPFVGTESLLLALLLDTESLATAALLAQGVTHARARRAVLRMGPASPAARG